MTGHVAGGALKLDVLAPAKVNLALCVEGRVEGGKHPLSTVMQAVSLCDKIAFVAVPGDPDIEVSMHGVGGVVAEDIPVEDNLVYRAVVEFCRIADVELSHHVSFKIDKAIPSQAGLGGGSSDCAAAIALTARLYGFDPRGPEAIDTARILGSDVAFFLEGGCALLDGFGDRVSRKLSSVPMHMVIARPDEGLSTPSVYNEFDRISGDSNDAYSRIYACISAMVELLEAGGGGAGGARDGRTVSSRIASLLANSLEIPAISLMPGIGDLLEALSGCDGVLGSRLSGSGSAVFAICDSRESAEAASRKMQEMDFWATACESVSFGAGAQDFRHDNRA